MFKVLAVDGISEEGLAPLRARKDIHLDVMSGKFDEKALCELIKGYNGVLIRSASIITKAVIEAAGPGLQVIGRAGVGVDNVNIPAATRAGVYVCNSPLGNVVAAAEHSIGMIFAACRQIPFAFKSLSLDRKWERSKFVGIEVKGRVLGLVGAGRVGSRVARVMKAAGMSVIAYDPYLNKESAAMMDIRVVPTIEQLFSEADVVSLHIPKTPETTGIVNKNLLSLMKPTGVIVNVARGGVINEEDLVEALRSNTIRCAAIDVFDPEPVDTETCPLFAEDLQGKIILTPHLGASTIEAQLQVAVDVSNQLVDVVDGKVPQWAINKCKRIQTINGMEIDEVQPMYDLATAIGSIGMQMAGGRTLKGIRVVVEGDSFLNRSSSNSLLPYACIGAMQWMGLTRVNIVNVEQECETRCIQLSSKDINHVTRQELSVILAFDEGSSISITGTLSTRLADNIILRSLCDTPCHMVLPMNVPGSLVYTLHEDRKGVLAAVTVALSQRGVNIGDCHLARSKSKVTAANISPARRNNHNSTAIALFFLEDEEQENEVCGKELYSALKDQGIIEVGVIKLGQ